MADLSPKQLRILKVLQSEGGWLERAQMEKQAGRKGFSLALGVPTRGEARPGSLEQLGYVERQDLTAPFEYRITAEGERALAEHEHEHGEVPLMSAVPPSPDEVDLEYGAPGAEPQVRRVMAATSPVADEVAEGATLHSITVSPSNPTLAAGGKQQFTATGWWYDGSPKRGRYKPQVGSEAHRIVTTLFQLRSATLDELVEELNDPKLDRQRVRSEMTTGKIGPKVYQEVNEKWSVKDGALVLTPSRITDTVRWTSSNTAVATIAPDGLATLLMPGSTTITATSRSLSSSPTLTVNEGVPPDITLNADQAGADDSADYFPQEFDRRRLVVRQIRERRGQQQFREVLRQRYGDRCLVTGCRVVAVLEDAHIDPYRGEGDNHPENGLLLRADIHTLFDLDLLGIEPDSLRVKLHPGVVEGYGNLEGKTLGCTGDCRPSQGALTRRYERFRQRIHHPA